MFRKIALVALFIALVAATLPTGQQCTSTQQCPSTACYFSQMNLIVNGGFENPQVASYDFFNTIQGWASENDKIQVGKGNIYNSGSLSTKGNQVVESVSGDFTRLYQVLKLPADTYLLKFNYACRQHPDVKPYKCALNLYWNEELILKLNTFDYEVQTAQVIVIADQGDNKITFQGVEMVNGIGMIIDNVELYQRNDFSNAPLATKQAFFEAVSGNIKKGRSCPLC